MKSISRYQREEAEANESSDARRGAAAAGADPGIESEPVTRKNTRARVLPTQNPCGRCQGAGSNT